MQPTPAAAAARFQRVSHNLCQHNLCQLTQEGKALSEYRIDLRDCMKVSSQLTVALCGCHLACCVRVGKSSLATQLDPTHDRVLSSACIPARLWMLSERCESPDRENRSRRDSLCDHRLHAAAAGRCPRRRLLSLAFFPLGVREVEPLYARRNTAVKRGMRLCSRVSLEGRRRVRCPRRSAKCSSCQLLARPALSLE